MRIVKNGDVHVSVPIGMPKREVERFIEEHRDWIAEARKKTCESQQRRAEFYNQLPLKTKEQKYLGLFLVSKYICDRYLPIIPNTSKTIPKPNSMTHIIDE